MEEHDFRTPFAEILMMGVGIIRKLVVLEMHQTKKGYNAAIKLIQNLVNSLNAFKKELKRLQSEGDI